VRYGLVSTNAPDVRLQRAIATGQRAVELCSNTRGRGRESRGCAISISSKYLTRARLGAD
jgi:hypothetical protein